MATASQGAEAPGEIGTVSPGAAASRYPAARHPFTHKETNMQINYPDGWTDAELATKLRKPSPPLGDQL
jgi:hypothetical protein